MTSSSPAPACSCRVWSSGKCWQATHLLLQLCEGGIFVEHALWFGLLDHRGRLVRMPASVCCVCDCSVCYVQCKASPERPAAPGTAGTNTTVTKTVYLILTICISNSPSAIQSDALAVLAVRQQNIYCSPAQCMNHSERESGQTTHKLYGSLADLLCTATFIEKTAVSIWWTRRTRRY